MCVVPLIPGTDVFEMISLLKSARHLNMQRKDGLDYVHQDCPGLYDRTSVRISIPFQQIFTRALGKRDGRSFRHLRHSFCSNLMNSGAEAAFVCKMTGHAGVNMLLRYLSTDMKSLEEQLLKSFRWAESQTKQITVPQILLHRQIPERTERTEPIEPKTMTL
jgi:integrase